VGAQGDEDIQGRCRGADFRVNRLKKGSHRCGAGVIGDDQEDLLSAVLGAGAELGDQGSDFGWRDGLVVGGDSGKGGVRAHGQ
jgi:hypothetical protein